MPEQEQGAGETDLSEETASDAAGTPAPPLNREQRRAQAKGKKGSAAAFNPASPHTQNVRGHGGGAPGAASRFQRKTGGK